VGHHGGTNPVKKNGGGPSKKKKNFIKGGVQMKRGAVVGPHQKRNFFPKRFCFSSGGFFR